MPFDMALGGMRVEVSTSHTEAAEPDLSCLDRHYDPAGPHPCIVTLVHGTWARGVLWASDHDYSGLKPYRPERRPSTLRGSSSKPLKAIGEGYAGSIGHPNSELSSAGIWRMRVSTPLFGPFGGVAVIRFTPAKRPPRSWPLSSART